MNFEKYLISFDHVHGGFRKRYIFDNGYGASVIQHSFSYGLELAVINDNYDLVYDTPITDDVVKYLNPEDVDPILEQIKNLPNGHTI